MSNECKFLKDGKCTIGGNKYDCEPSSIEWFKDKMKVVEIEDVCRTGSIFGNYYIGITEEQLDALKHGKILYHFDEYGTFIGLVKGD